MKKSLVVIASALLLAVGAAGTQRLRYDATVFANAERVSQETGRRAAQVEYPPCVRGVREDRCIQLYERGVRRSYARWLAAHGGRQATAAPPSTRRYRPCRSRSDDNCQQVARTRSAVTTRRASARRAVAARNVARSRAATVNRTRWTRAAAAARTRRATPAAPVRRTAPAAVRTARPQPAAPPPRGAPAPRNAPVSRNTPGI